MAVAERLKVALSRRKNSWPVLTQLLTLIWTLSSWGELAKRLQMQREIVRNIAHSLHMKSLAPQVQQALRAYLDRLQDEAPLQGRGAPRGRYIKVVVAITDRFWGGLFACYDHPRLPANNNALERFLAP